MKIPLHAQTFPLWAAFVTSQPQIVTKRARRKALWVAPKGKRAAGSASTTLRVGYDFLIPANRRLSTWLAFGETYIQTADQSAEAAQDGGELGRTGSVSAQNRLAKATLKLVRGVGQGVENKFAADQTVLDEWRSASKIEARDARLKTSAAPPIKPA